MQPTFPAYDQRRPSQCEPAAGEVFPVIDRGRCDGKQDCVAVCPFDIFEMRPLTQAEAYAAPVPARQKQKLVGRWQAFVVRPDACHACNLCVVACPEDAIRLIARPRPPVLDTRAQTAAEIKIETDLEETEPAA